MKLRTIFGGNKSASDIRKQIDNVELHTNIMITRLPKSTFDSIQWDTDKIVMRNAEKAYNVRGIHSLSYCISSQTAFIYRNPRKSELSVAITSAGLADRHVVDEAGLTVLLSGYTPVYFNDIAVDNIHKTLALNTLTGLVDYIKSERDRLDDTKLIVHVVSPTRVELYSELFMENIRNRFATVEAILPSYAYERFYPVDEFNIKLQVCLHRCRASRYFN